MTRLSAWFSSSRKGVKWLVAAVITAGALATAVGAIHSLWPDPPKPIAELSAEISEVRIDRDVRLDQYQAREGADSAADEGDSTAPSPTGKAQLAAVTFAQSGNVIPTTPDEATTTDDATTTDETTTTDDTTTTDETTTTEEPTTTDDEPADREGDEDGVLRRPLTDQARARLRVGVERALESQELLAPTDLGEACSRELTGRECGLSSQLAYLQVLDEEGEPTQVNEEIVAEHLAGLLAGTRMVLLASGMEQPVGVTVYFKVSLTGFRGREVHVRWALHSDEGGGEVPEDWLKNQSRLRLKAKAEKDSASPALWIPLPKDRRPYFIRLTVYDEDGVPLDRANTSSFR